MKSCPSGTSTPAEHPQPSPVDRAIGTTLRRWLRRLSLHQYEKSQRNLASISLMARAYRAPVPMRSGQARLYGEFLSIPPSQAQGATTAPTSRRDPARQLSAVGTADRQQLSADTIRQRFRRIAFAAESSLWVLPLFAAIIGSRRDHRANEPSRSSAAAIGCRHCRPAAVVSGHHPQSACPIAFGTGASLWVVP